MHMRLLIKLSILIVFTSLSSCRIQQSISAVPPDNNKTYKVEYLFEHEGCKVYRFRDFGRYVYFTNCGGEVSSIVNDSTQIRVVNTIPTRLPK